MKKQMSCKWIIGAVVVIILLIPMAIVFWQSRYNIFPHMAESAVVQSSPHAFPVIDTSTLSETQKKVVTILKQEYELQPGGTKYSEGVDEAWCADFVSWVYREAGVPLKNPNNNYWRIPGTRTLRDYYEQIGKFKAADSDYSPRVGDVMLYDNPSPFGQHVNIVIKNDHGVVTTIGGNEPGGIRIVEHTTPDGAGFLGYGVF